MTRETGERLVLDGSDAKALERARRLQQLSEASGMLFPFSVPFVSRDSQKKSQALLARAFFRQLSAAEKSFTKESIDSRTTPAATSTSSPGEYKQKTFEPLKKESQRVSDIDLVRGVISPMSGKASLGWKQILICSSDDYVSGIEVSQVVSRISGDLASLMRGFSEFIGAHKEFLEALGAVEDKTRVDDKSLANLIGVYEGWGQWVKNFTALEEQIDLALASGSSDSPLPLFLREVLDGLKGKYQKQKKLCQKNQQSIAEQLKVIFEAREDYDFGNIRQIDVVVDEQVVVSSDGSVNPDSVSADPDGLLGGVKLGMKNAVTRAVPIDKMIAQYRSGKRFLGFRYGQISFDDLDPALSLDIAREEGNSLKKRLIMWRNLMLCGGAYGGKSRIIDSSFVSTDGLDGERRFWGNGQNRKLLQQAGFSLVDLNPAALVAYAVFLEKSTENESYKEAMRKKIAAAIFLQRKFYNQFGHIEILRSFTVFASGVSHCSELQLAADAHHEGGARASFYGKDGVGNAGKYLQTAFKEQDGAGDDGKKYFNVIKGVSTFDWYSDSSVGGGGFDLDIFAQQYIGKFASDLGECPVIQGRARAEERVETTSKYFNEHFKVVRYRVPASAPILSTDGREKQSAINSLICPISLEKELFEDKVDGSDRNRKVSTQIDSVVAVLLDEKFKKNLQHLDRRLSVLQTSEIGSSSLQDCALALTYVNESLVFLNEILDHLAKHQHGSDFIFNRLRYKVLKEYTERMVQIGDDLLESKEQWERAQLRISKFEIFDLPDAVEYVDGGEDAVHTAQGEIDDVSAMLVELRREAEASRIRQEKKDQHYAALSSSLVQASQSGRLTREEIEGYFSSTSTFVGSVMQKVSQTTADDVMNTGSADELARAITVMGTCYELTPTEAPLGWMERAKRWLNSWLKKDQGLEEVSAQVSATATEVAKLITDYLTGNGDSLAKASVNTQKMAAIVTVLNEMMPWQDGGSDVEQTFSYRLVKLLQNRYDPNVKGAANREKFLVALATAVDSAELKGRVEKFVGDRKGRIYGLTVSVVNDVFPKEGEVMLLDKLTGKAGGDDEEAIPQNEHAQKLGIQSISDLLTRVQTILDDESESGDEGRAHKIRKMVYDYVRTFAKGGIRHAKPINMDFAPLVLKVLREGEFEENGARQIFARARLTGLLAYYEADDGHEKVLKRDHFSVENDSLLQPMWAKDETCYHMIERAVAELEKNACDSNYCDPGLFVSPEMHDSRLRKSVLVVIVDELSETGEQKDAYEQLRKRINLLYLQQYLATLNKENESERPLFDIGSLSPGLYLEADWEKVVNALDKAIAASFEFNDLRALHELQLVVEEIGLSKQKEEVNLAKIAYALRNPAGAEAKIIFDELPGTFDDEEAVTIKERLIKLVQESAADKMPSSIAWKLAKKYSREMPELRIACAHGYLRVEFGGDSRGTILAEEQQEKQQEIREFCVSTHDVLENIVADADFKELLVATLSNGKFLEFSDEVWDVVRQLLLKVDSWKEHVNKKQEDGVKKGLLDALRDCFEAKDDYDSISEALGQVMIVSAYGIPEELREVVANLILSKSAALWHFSKAAGQATACKVGGVDSNITISVGDDEVEVMRAAIAQLDGRMVPVFLVQTEWKTCQLGKDLQGLVDFGGKSDWGLEIDLAEQLLPQIGGMDNVLRLMWLLDDASREKLLRALDIEIDRLKAHVESKGKCSNPFQYGALLALHRLFSKTKGEIYNLDPEYTRCDLGTYLDDTSIDVNVLTFYFATQKVVAEQQLAQSQMDDGDGSSVSAGSSPRSISPSGSGAGRISPAGSSDGGGSHSSGGVWGAFASLVTGAVSPTRSRDDSLGRRRADSGGSSASTSSSKFQKAAQELSYRLGVSVSDESDELVCALVPTVWLAYPSCQFLQSLYNEGSGRGAVLHQEITKRYIGEEPVLSGILNIRSLLALEDFYAEGQENLGKRFSIIVEAFDGLVALQEKNPEMVKQFKEELHKLREKLKESAFNKLASGRSSLLSVESGVLWQRLQTILQFLNREYVQAVSLDVDDEQDGDSDSFTLGHDETESLLEVVLKVLRGLLIVFGQEQKTLLGDPKKYPSGDVAEACTWLTSLIEKKDGGYNCFVDMLRNMVLLIERFGSAEQKQQLQELTDTLKVVYMLRDSGSDELPAAASAAQGAIAAGLRGDKRKKKQAMLKALGVVDSEAAASPSLSLRQHLVGLVSRVMILLDVNLDSSGVCAEERSVIDEQLEIVRDVLRRMKDGVTIDQTLYQQLSQALLVISSQLVVTFNNLGGDDAQSKKDQRYKLLRLIESISGLADSLNQYGEKEIVVQRGERVNVTERQGEFVIIDQDARKNASLYVRFVVTLGGDKKLMGSTGSFPSDTDDVAIDSLRINITGKTIRAFTKLSEQNKKRFLSFVSDHLTYLLRETPLDRDGLLSLIEIMHLYSATFKVEAGRDGVTSEQIEELKSAQINMDKLVLEAACKLMEHTFKARGEIDSGLVLGETLQGIFADAGFTDFMARVEERYDDEAVKLKFVLRLQLLAYICRGANEGKIKERAKAVIEKYPAIFYKGVDVLRYKKYCEEGKLGLVVNSLLTGGGGSESRREDTRSYLSEFVKCSSAAEGFYEELFDDGERKLIGEAFVAIDSGMKKLSKEELAIYDGKFKEDVLRHKIGNDKYYAQKEREAREEKFERTVRQTLHPEGGAQSIVDRYDIETDRGSSYSQVGYKLTRRGSCSDLSVVAAARAVEKSAQKIRRDDIDIDVINKYDLAAQAGSEVKSEPSSSYGRAHQLLSEAEGCKGFIDDMAVVAASTVKETTEEAKERLRALPSIVLADEDRDRSALSADPV